MDQCRLVSIRTVCAAQLRAIHSQVTGGPAEEDFSHLLGDLENDFYLELQGDAYRFHTKVLRDWWVRFYGFE